MCAVREDIARHKGAVQHVALSPEGHLLATACDEDHTVRLWDLRTPKHAAVRAVWFRAPRGCAEPDSLASTCFGAYPDELFVACGPTVRRCDLRAAKTTVVPGDRLPVVHTAEDDVNELAYCASAPPMASGAPLLAAADDTGVVTVRCAATGEKYRLLDKAHTNVCSHLLLFFPTLPNSPPFPFFPSILTPQEGGQTRERDGGEKNTNTKALTHNFPAPLALIKFPLHRFAVRSSGTRRSGRAW